MIETHEQAFDEINTILLDAWKDNSTTSQIPIVWGNVVNERQGTVDYFEQTEPWLLVETIYETAITASLKGSSGIKRTHRGMIVAIIYVQLGKGAVHALPLISVAADAFEGIKTPGGVWFRNPQISTIGKDGTWYTMSMDAKFEYDLIR